MELVVRDATVTIKPKDPNSKEMVILKDATVITKTKELKDKNTIIISPLKESVVEIGFGEGERHE